MSIRRKIISVPRLRRDSPGARSCRPPKLRPRTNRSGRPPEACRWNRAAPACGCRRPCPQPSRGSRKSMPAISPSLWRWSRYCRTARYCSRVARGTRMERARSAVAPLDARERALELEAGDEDAHWDAALQPVQAGRYAMEWLRRKPARDKSSYWSCAAAPVSSVTSLRSEAARQVGAGQLGGDHEELWGGAALDRHVCFSMRLSIVA